MLKGCRASWRQSERQASARGAVNTHVTAGVHFVLHSRREWEPVEGPKNSGRVSQLKEVGR